MNKINENIILFKNKLECCGCGACMNACPKQAISMKKDEYGFIFPQIDKSKCVNCGICKKVCGYQSIITSPQKNTTYVAVAKNEEILNNSASGGIFASLATSVINLGGVVFGCSMEYVNNKLTAKHIMVDCLNDLKKLQGSKYVQSNINDTYTQAKNKLNKGILVLFSGTPCQIDGLKHFLNMKSYDNLITVDLVCHGVPNQQIFQDYIVELEKKLKGEVIGFKFRDKFHGWGLNAKVEYRKNNTKLSKFISCDCSSYYKLFLESLIYRENCYSCKYASANRVADLTIGDFWGIKSEHPQYLKSIDISKGVSFIIVNNIQGEKMLKELCNNIKLFTSTFEHASRANGQLNHPSKISKQREKILNIYKNQGYKSMESWYKKYQGTSYYKNHLKALIPFRLKKYIKTLLNK